jgi:hypothetical protein
MADDTEWRRIGIFFDAIKALGTGNTAGLLGAGVALYYFSTRHPTIIWHIKAACGWYLAGIALFAIAYFFFFVGTLTYRDQIFDIRPSPHSKPQATIAIIATFGSFVCWSIGTGIAARVIYIL